MKKPLLLVLALPAALVLGACGGTVSSSTGGVASTSSKGTTSGVVSESASQTNSSSSESSSSSSSVADPEVSLDQSALDAYVDEDSVLTATITNFDGTPIWSIDDENAALVTPSEDGAKATITGISAGATATVTVTCGTAKATCAIKVHYHATEAPVYTDFDVYDANSVKQGTYNGFYAAFDAMQTAALDIGAFITNANETTPVYTLSANAYNFLTKTGVYNGYDTNSNVTNGQASWWSTYVTDLSLYINSEANMLQTSGGYANYFVSRATDWKSMADWAGGYYGTDSPDGTWNGWQAAVLKSAVTVAQYTSWADSTVYGVKTMTGHYDLKKNVIRPSADANQPVTADIWFGEQAATATPVQIGITFDAGTLADCENLANGTKRNWYMFYQEQAINGGLASPLPATRTIDSEHPIATAKWDALDKVWIVNFAADITVSYNFSDENGGANFGLGLSVAVGTNTFNLDYASGAVYNRGVTRLTYGVDFTPVTATNSRKVANINCGAGWYGVKQGSVTATNVDGTLQTKDYSFASGRANNGAYFMGLYGGDCVTATKDVTNGTMAFDFVY